MAAPSRSRPVYLATTGRTPLESPSPLALTIGARLGPLRIFPHWAPAARSADPRLAQPLEHRRHLRLRRVDARARAGAGTRRRTPTLADRVAQGPIPFDEALPIARQIAEALEAAHEHGVIHRDLKPANIKLRPDGTVKVLDFGLAKLAEPVDAASVHKDATRLPMITSPAMVTGVGMILGTAAYMAPEQARGKAVDKRADIWAFGVVLYEMLAGRRAFEDDDVATTLARVLQQEPDFDSLPPSVPARVDRALAVCLRKDPKQRAGDIRDVRLALDGAFDTVTAQTSALAAAPPRWRSLLVGAAALLAGGALATTLTWFGSRPAEVRPPRVSRLHVTIPWVTRRWPSAATTPSWQSRPMGLASSTSATGARSSLSGRWRPSNQ